MMTKEEALEQGIWALESILANHKGAPVLAWVQAMDAMKDALLPRAQRNAVLEEVALEIDKMKVFEADTMASIAAFIRDMKK
jgi:hypothetical protein